MGMPVYEMKGMKGMKPVKIFSVLVISALLLTATGCSYGSTATSTVSQKKTTQTAAQQSDRILPALPSPAATIDVVAHTSTDTSDGDLAARSLQGLINKKQPRVYIADEWYREGVDVEALRQKILEVYGGRKINVLTPDASHKADQDFWTIFNKYHAEVKRLYVYDSTLPDTINVAVMLAGRNQGIAVSASFAKEFSQYNLPQVDVRSKYGFTNHLQILKWIRDNMVSSSNKKVVFCLSPQGRDSNSDMLPEAYDMAVATDSLIYHVNPYLPTEVEIQQEILDKYATGTPVIGWADASDEGDYVKSISKAGKAAVCTDWGFPNGSVWSAFPKFVQKAAGGETSETQTPVAGKTYVAFCVSDGDAWHYSSRDLLSFWNQSVRGQQPIGWTVPSLYSEAAPLLLYYLYNTKSGKDEFIQGPSGYGYVYPSKMPAQAYATYLQKTKSVLDPLGISMVNLWDLVEGSNSMTGNNQNIIKQYVSIVKPRALFLGHDGSGSASMVGDTPVLQEVGNNLGAGTRSASDIVKAVERARAKVSSDKPSFVMVNIEAWGDGVSSIEAAVEALKESDPSAYEFVEPSELAAIFKSYSAGKVSPASASQTASTVKAFSVSFNADGGAVEKKYLAVDDSNGTMGYDHRFADKASYWVYRFDLPGASTYPRLQADVSGQYQISASTDGKLWTVLKSSVGIESRMVVYADLSSVLSAHSKTLYLKFSDADPTNGFGPSLYSLEIDG